MKSFQSSTQQEPKVDPQILPGKNAGQRSEHVGRPRSASFKKSDIPESLEDQVNFYKEQLSQEKAVKRKFFHSLVKISKELQQKEDASRLFMEQQKFQEKTWYEGGLWRSPAVLPAVSLSQAPQQQQQQQRTRMPAISLSDLFFSLVIVTAFTRVGVAISEHGLTGASFLYFAVFWTIWSKETSYSTRFETSDLSAQIETLLTCFAVLFGSLSVQLPLQSPEATRVMMVAAAVALLHALLHLRVAYTTRFFIQDTLTDHVREYAVFNVCMNMMEALVWIVGIFALPWDWKHRWIVFVIGVILALRVPRAFLANDFHAACSKRGVLFILLLGFLLQSIAVVASEFFTYQTPSFFDYAFVGAACLMLFCIKLLYVEESVGLAGDHALLVNRWAGFFFNLGNFSLLFSTTIMGSGLNLLTHSYLAATAALPGPAKTLVCGGFSAVLFSIFVIKSMHLKRVPLDPHHRAWFVGAYIVQSVALMGVVVTTAVMCTDLAHGSGLAYLLQNDIQLLFFLSGAALFVLLMSWLDEGVELSLYQSAEDSRAFRIHPFGFWWCLQAEIDDTDVEIAEEADLVRRSSLSAFSPLLGSSLADLRLSGYGTSSRDDLMALVKSAR